MSVESLYKEYEGREDESELLDDFVHEAASQIGSAANNGGLYDQIEFLLSNGFPEKDIRECMDHKTLP